MLGAWHLPLIVLALLPAALAAVPSPERPDTTGLPETSNARSTAPADTSDSAPLPSDRMPGFDLWYRPPLTAGQHPADAAARRRVVELVRLARRRGTSDSTKYELARQLADTGTIEGRRRALELLRRIQPRYGNRKEYHWERARIYESGRHTSQVRRSLQEVLRLDPGEVEAYVELARLRLDDLLSRFDPTLAAPMFGPLDQALALDPDHRDALFLKSLGLEFVADGPEQASPQLSRQGIECLRRILARDPDDAAARLLLAVHCLDLDDREAAAAQFDTALARAPAALRQAFLDSCWTTAPIDTEDAPALAATVRDEVNRTYWRSHDPTPLSLLNESQLEIWKRLALADILFGHPESGQRGWETGPGEALVRYGKPTARTYEPASAFPVTTLDRALPPFGLIDDLDAGGWSFANRVFKPPTWRWYYRFHGLEFTLGFQDDCLNGRYAFDDRSRWRLEGMRRRTPVVFDAAPPGDIRHVYIAAAGVAGEGRWVEQAIDVGIPLWRSDRPRRWLEKVRLQVVVRDSSRAVVRQSVHDVTPADVASIRLDDRFGFLLWRSDFKLPPGRYSVSAFVEDRDGRVQGSFSRPFEVRDYAARRTLTVSDLALAFGAGDSTRGPTVLRAGQRCLPDPLGFAGRDRRLEIYYDLYGLGEMAGRSRHQVRVTILPRTSVLEFEGMVRDGRARPNDLVSFAARQASAGAALDERNYFDVFFPPVTMPVEIDRAAKATRLTLPDLDPGEYAVVISVTDHLTRAAALGTTFFRVLSGRQRAELLAYARGGAPRSD